MSARDVLICDTECYPNFWSIGFKRVSDGKVLVMEHSHRKQLNRDRLGRLMSDHRIVTFNGMSYDLPMIYLAINGASNAELKQANDRIIMGGVKYWEVEDLLGIRIPRIDHVDLIEPQPNAFASLKTLNGRLHGPKMQDLPHEPDTRLSDAQMDEVLAYMVNDLDATEGLYEALIPALELREALSAEYKFNFLSKSDSQIGETIVKKRVEHLTGERVERVPTAPGTTFRYPAPAYLRFETPQLQTILERVRTNEFIVKADGKVDLPKWLSDTRLTLGTSTYVMGIGGLHSTEAKRTVVSDPEHQLRDFDVASFYPAIIINSGLYPKALGRQFTEIFRKLRDERVVAKRAGNKTKAEGLKIALNGCFGKLGSIYSVLYAPHLLTTVTLTGQLVLLMLIERAELAGIPVVSANTDGVVFRVPRAREADLFAIARQWEADTGFELEDTPYQSLHSQSVNTYIAIKPDGKVKRKGTLANPRAEGDMRGQLMKNPQMEICSDAVVAYLQHGTPLGDTIRASRDIRDFVTVVKVQGGGTWRGEYLGKVVRYIWSITGEEILYKKPHPTTGNFKKVSKSDGCQPLMDLPPEGEWPEDLDYGRYVAAADEILCDIGAVYRRPPVVRPLRVYKHSAVLWWAIAV